MVFRHLLAGVFSLTLWSQKIKILCSGDVIDIHVFLCKIVQRYKKFQLCAVGLHIALGSIHFVHTLRGREIDERLLHTLAYKVGEGKTRTSNRRASPKNWSCYANFKSSFFISFEIDHFHD